jgi:hypothetical protein
MADTPILAPKVTVSPNQKPVEELPIGEGFNNDESAGLPEGTRYVGPASSLTQWKFGDADSQELPEGTRFVDYLNATPGEKVGEALIGAAQGATETASIFGTGVAGARIGMQVAAPFTPAFGPAAPIVGATVGGLAGLTAGYMASQEFDKMYPELSREDLAPYREGGYTFGSSIAFSPVSFGLPLANASRISRFLTVPQSIRKNPIPFVAAETMGAAGAGIGGGVAEYYAPGEMAPRLGAEMVGGYFTPGRFIVSSSGALIDSLRNIRSSFSQDARETRAANRIVKILSDNGEDVEGLIKSLNKDIPISVSPTAAQKTGSLGLSILEKSLSRTHSKYGAAVVKQGEDASAAYEKLIQELTDIGSPDALKAIAKLREGKFTELLEARKLNADEIAADKISRISKDTPESREEIGKIVRSETERALADMRQHEGKLWDEAIKASYKIKKIKGQKVVELNKVTPNSTGQSALEIADTLGPDFFKSTIPIDVRNALSRLGITPDSIQRYAAGKRTVEYLETGIVPSQYLTKMEGKKAVSIFKESTVPDLITLRSNLLRMSREAAADGKVANASFYSKIAESVLDDLSTLPNPAYDEARQFSRLLNDNFTRSYANDVAAVTKQGADRLPPELLVAKAFGSGQDLTAFRMNDIERAVGTLKTKYDDAVAQFGPNSPQAQELLPYAQTAESAVVSVKDAHTRVMRLAAAKTIDPITGRVNPTTLQRFVNENKAVLDRLGITNDLTDAVKAQNAFDTIKREMTPINNEVRSQAAFAKVLKGGESPSMAISDALNSRNPVKSLSSIIMLARSGGPEAVAGLKSSVYDYMFARAGGSDNFSPIAFNKAFFGKIKPGQPSVYEILRQKDAMSITEGKNLRKLITPMTRIEFAIKNNQIEDDIVQGADALTELALRVTGAKAGAALAPGGGGALVAASAGSKAMRKQFDKMPSFMVRNIIEEATKDPKLMAILLAKGRTPKEKYQLARQMHGYLYAAGLNTAPMDEEPEPTDDQPIYPGDRARRLLRQMPPAPNTRGTSAKPNAPNPYEGGTALTPMPAPQGPAPVSTSRKLLQSLFPMDSISAMGVE